MATIAESITAQAVAAGYDGDTPKTINEALTAFYGEEAVKGATIAATIAANAEEDDDGTS